MTAEVQLENPVRNSKEGKDTLEKGKISNGVDQVGPFGIIPMNNEL